MVELAFAGLHQTIKPDPLIGLFAVALSSDGACPNSVKRSLIEK
jgi:hypothetical protein